MYLTRNTHNVCTKRELNKWSSKRVTVEHQLLFVIVLITVTGDSDH